VKVVFLWNILLHTAISIYYYILLYEYIITYLLSQYIITYCSINILLHTALPTYY
jgi:hypothetical protein